MEFGYERINRKLMVDLSRKVLVPVFGPLLLKWFLGLGCNLPIQVQLRFSDARGRLLNQIKL